MNQTTEGELAEKRAKLCEAFADEHEDIRRGIRITVSMLIRKGELKCSDPEDFVDTVLAEVCVRVLSDEQLRKYKVHFVPIAWIMGYSKNIIKEQRRESIKKSVVQVATDINSNTELTPVDEILSNIADSQQNGRNDEQISNQIDISDRISREVSFSHSTLRQKFLSNFPLEEGEVEKLLLHLPKHKREILKMKYIDNLSNKEISTRTGKSEPAIRKIIQRIKDSMIA
jgi:RNA polymerase sigma factor (sigma-70 family)